MALAERAGDDARLLDRLGIPPSSRAMVRRSWRSAELSLYGRFDFAFDGRTSPKLLEFNADTPTTLYETAVFQWLWLQDRRRCGVLPAEADQFNGLHDALVARWRMILSGGDLHLAAMDDAEDQGTIAYLAETARAAGSRTVAMTMDDIGILHDHFVDLRDRPIERLFKLYPWEWLLADAFGRQAAALHATTFIEPPWKMLLSTKAVLPLLWELAPGHPNLLPARFADERGGVDVGPRYARKPCLSREGSNVTLVADDIILAAVGGSYGGRAVLQALAPLPDFDGNHPVIGSWLVGDEPCGIGIREDRGLITSNASRFVPHAVVG